MLQGSSLLSSARGVPDVVVVVVVRVANSLFRAKAMVAENAVQKSANHILT